MAVKISGMMGTGSMGHNNRKFITENVDPARTEQNITLRRENLKQVYHELFDEALAEYNAKKTKTRDKIPDYYRHIEKSKQERLFHEVIFQIGNKDNCGCETPEGERAAAALKEFAEAFQERNPHLRVFNSVIHMDEATPHIHIDFVPVATEQKRGLTKRVSLKQALAQQGFTGQSKRQTEWNAWVNSEKLVLEQIAQVHEFEIISLGGGRPHMDLPQYREAAQRLEAVQEQVTAGEHDIAELEKQKKALQGTVRRLQAAEKVRVDLEAIQPERTLTGAVRGVTVEQVEELKAAAIRGAAAEYDVLELKKENRQLHSQMPSIRERLKEAEERKKLEQENKKLKSYAVVLEDELVKERDFIEKLLAGLSEALDFLEKHLPEPLQPLLEKLQKLVNAPEVVMRGMDQPEPEQEPERGHTWGDMTM